MRKELIFGGIGALAGAVTAGVGIYIFMRGKNDTKLKAQRKELDQVINGLLKCNALTNEQKTEILEAMNGIEHHADGTMTINDVPVPVETQGPTNVNITSADELFRQKVSDIKNTAKYAGGMFTDVSGVRDDEIEVISREAFGEEFTDYRGQQVKYDTLEYHYYSDGIFTDERDDVIDACASFGPHFIEDFRTTCFHDGDVMPNSMYLRNHKMECDIEITPDFLSYKEDVMPRKPAPANLDLFEDDEPDETESEGDVEYDV